MKHKGFDPLTQDYAGSQGYPLFELLDTVQDSHHFEIVEDCTNGRFLLILLFTSS